MWGKEHAYDSLTEFDHALNIKPALATSWKVESKTSILFNLRKGVKFHNGKEFTADDVSLLRQEHAQGAAARQPGRRCERARDDHRGQVVSKYWCG